MSATHPWTLNPALQQSRLLLLAQTAVEIRNKAFSEANRDEGDTNWGIGCKAHERLGHALCRLAESGRHPWLKVHRDGLYLMPLIDDIAVRIYRGPADRPGQRHLDAARSELRRAQPRQMAFSFMSTVEEEADGPWFWMMALETNAEGKVLRAVFFQANEAGETRHPWEAPLDSALVAQRAEGATAQAHEEMPADGASPAVHEDVKAPEFPEALDRAAAAGPAAPRSRERVRLGALPSKTRRPAARRPHTTSPASPPAQ